MIIAIDGPAGTGKSTIAGIVAEKLKITYLNSGSFYRALTLALVENNIDLDDENKILKFSANQQLDYKKSRLYLNGKDVESILHNDVISAHVAQISAIPEIRHIVNKRMHEITKSQSIICEGRDMTTVVFPEADYKFYLDASIEVQAERRYSQGVSNLSLEQIKNNIIERDKIDKNKKEGSLVIAEDAIYIDTSDLTIEQVCAIILNKIYV